jgi:hypothetical protein
MHVDRSRLLFLLILVSVVTAATWTMALASGTTGRATVASAWLSASKPGATPTSGEPDVGQTPRPQTWGGSMSHAPRGERDRKPGRQADPWFDWIIRMWITSHLGAR